MAGSLGVALAEVAQRLAGGDVVEGLQLVVERTAAHVPDADVWAFLAVGDGQRLLATTATVDPPAGRGPCVDAIAHGEDVAATSPEEVRDRWPEVAEALLAAGYLAVHAIPLGVNGRCVGTLLVTRRSPSRLEEPELEAARAFAALASVALSLQSRGELADQLQHALDARVTVEQAKGVVAGSLRLSVGDALEVLRRYARDRNLRLAEVADDVVRGSVRPEDLQRSS